MSETENSHYTVSGLHCHYQGELVVGSVIKPLAPNSQVNATTPVKFPSVTVEMCPLKP